MLRFLRNIRIKALRSSSTHKYLLYAIGEILLVMIGILLALQVNNWNEYRMERKLEQELLIEIEESLETNIQNLKEHLVRIDRLNQHSQQVIDWIEYRGPYVQQLDTAFYRSFFSATNFYMTDAGYEGLKNAGFETIKNRELKNAVVNLFGVGHSKETQFIQYLQRNFNNYETFLVSNFISGERALTPIDPTDLQVDPKFKAIITRMKERRNRIKDRLTSYLSKSQSVLDIVKKELAKIYN